MNFFESIHTICERITQIVFFMLSILIELSLCARMKLAAPNDSKKAAFDLVFFSDGTETSITSKEGFYVAFRDKDDEKGELKFLQYNSEILTSRYNVYMGTHDDRDAYCLRLFNYKFIAEDMKEGICKLYYPH